MDGVGKSPGVSRRAPAASWQGLKRHADLLPLRPHPSYFLPHQPHHPYSPVPARAWTQEDGDHCRDLPSSPASPRLADEHQDRETPLTRSALSEHKTIERQVQSAPTTLAVDNMQYAQWRKFYHTLNKTDDVLARKETTSFLPKVNSDPHLKSSSQRHIGGRLLQHKYHSMSDLSRRVPGLEHSSHSSKNARKLMEMSHSVSKPETSSAKCPDSGHYCQQHHGFSVPLSSTAHFNDIFLTSGAPSHFTFLTSQAKSSTIVSDVYSCGKSIVSAKIDSSLESCGENSEVRKCRTEIHLPLPLMPATNCTGMTDRKSITQTEPSRRQHVASAWIDCINSTPHCHATGNNTGTRSSLAPHTQALEEPHRLQKHWTPLEWNKRFTMAEHRTELNALGHTSRSNSLCLQSPLAAATRVAVSIANASSLGNIRGQAVDHISTRNLKSTETGADTPDTLTEDSRKRPPYSSMQSEKNRAKDHTIQNNGEDHLETRSKSTKRIRTLSYHIHNLSASESELESILHNQAKRNGDYEKSPLCADERENQEMQLQVKVGVISNTPAEAQQFKSAVKSDSEFSIDRKYSHICDCSSSSAGLSQISREIRSAIMEESYEVSKMRPSRHDEEPDKFNRDMSKADISETENGLSALLHRRTPQPLPLYMNSAKDVDVTQSNRTVPGNNLSYEHTMSQSPSNYEYTTSQSSNFKPPQVPQFFMRDYDFPSYLTLAMCAQNPQHSLVSPCAHFHNVCTDICQSVPSSDLLSTHHTYHQGPTARQTGIVDIPTLCQPAVVRVPPHLKPEIGQGNVSSQHVSLGRLSGVSSPQSGRSHEQWTADRVHDQQEIVSFRAETTHSVTMCNPSITESRSHTRPTMSECWQYSPACIFSFPDARSDSVKGRLD